MIRVFVSNSDLVGGRLVLTHESARHVGGALRARSGEGLVAVTEDGVEHTCRVLSASVKEVIAEVLDSRPSRAEPARHIRVCQALLKGDQFERILEYGSELGVGSFQPMITERTVARPAVDRLLTRMDRWRQVCRQGAELAQRGRIPEMLAPASLQDAVASAIEDRMRTFLLYEGQDLPGLSAVAPAEGACCLVVGPEGGWSEAEVMLAREAGAEPVSLGPRIMRPLPAVLAAVAVALDRSHDLDLPAKED
ncbi:MAG: RsmE family RNA methyltransferase [Candidatus Dormibacteria bacterium]